MLATPPNDWCITTMAIFRCRVDLLAPCRGSGLAASQFRASSTPDVRSPWAGWRTATAASCSSSGDSGTERSGGARVFAPASRCLATTLQRTPDLQWHCRRGDSASPESNFPEVFQP